MLKRFQRKVDKVNARKVLDRVCECVNKLNELMDSDEFVHPYMITVEFRNSGKRAGLCYSSVKKFDRINNSHKLVFNSLIIDKELDHILDVTIPHEVCHMFANAIYMATDGPQGHGKNWKDLMSALGLSPERTAPQELNIHGLYNGHIYKCGCKEHVIGESMHNNDYEYMCCSCNGIVKDTGVVVQKIHYEKQRFELEYEKKINWK